MKNLFVFCLLILLSAALLPAQGDHPKKNKAEKVEATDPGQALYKKHCSLCHGDDGDKGLLGASPLSKSTQGVKTINALIRNGKGKMKPNTEMTDEEVALVITYIKGLRK